MAKPCSHICSKVYLIVFNLIFLLAGGATLALGVWMSIDKDTFMALQIAQGANGQLFDRLPYAMMGIGGAMMVVCFMGGCGACAESVCFLSFYSVILFLLILAQIIMIIVAVMQKEDFTESFSRRMRDQVRTSYNRSAVRDVNKTDILTYAWDAMQVELKCCGAHNPMDFELSTWWNHSKNSEGMTVPHTCCVLYNDNPEVPMVRNNGECQIQASIYRRWLKAPEKEREPLDELHTEGCVDAVLGWIKEHSDIFISVTVTSIVLQVLGLFCSCFLIVRLKREHSKDWTDEDLREDK